MKIALAAAFVAAFLVACGGGSSDDMLHVCAGENTTPASLDPDYAPGFVGTFAGTVTIAVEGVPTEYIPVQFTVARSSANKLAIQDLLKGTAIGLVTSATDADLACMTGTTSADCGQITLTYSNGTATLVNDGGAVDIEMDATAAGCGQVANGTVTLDQAIRIGGPALMQGEAAASTPRPTLDDAVAKALGARLSR